MENVFGVLDIEPVLLFFPHLSKTFGLIFFPYFVAFYLFIYLIRFLKSKKTHFFVFMTLGEKEKVDCQTNAYHGAFTDRNVVVFINFMNFIIFGHNILNFVKDDAQKALIVRNVRARQKEKIVKLMQKKRLILKTKR